MAATVKRGAGNPNWKKGMPSANPKGRPKGIIDKRQRVAREMLNDAQEITRVVVDKAKDGDLQAATLVLSRVLPALSTQSEKVQFDLDPEAPLTQQCEQVLAAMADGEISPDTAKQIIETLGALSSIRQIEDIEERVKKLETA